MAQHIPVKWSDIRIDKPIPYSIYDKEGRLLLRGGSVISIPEYIDALRKRGAYFDGSEAAPAEALAATAPEASAQAPKRPVPEQGAFEQTEGLLLKLRHIHATTLQHPDRIELQKSIRQVAEQLQQACDADTDAALACLHLDQTAPYRVHHHLLSALVIELTGRELQVPLSTRLSLCCGALTHDLALADAAESIEGTRQPLSESQQAMIKAHPARTVDMLRERGINDPVWLEAIAQHHERLDGSGYPGGLQGDAISKSGRLMAIADIYSAMIRSRPYRENAFFPQNALRDIFLDKTKLDTALAQLTIKSIGIMPPGSVMRLQNQEIGVVRSRGNGATAVRVFSIYGANGMPLMTPVERDIKNPAFAVAGKVTLQECRSAEVIMRRIWKK